MVDSQKSLSGFRSRPRNPNDLLFRGTMWITLDGRYAIQKLRLLVSKSINFNFVREMNINQDFTRQADGRYLLTKSDVLGDFGINKSGTGLYGEREVTYINFTTNIPVADSVFKGPVTVMLDSAEGLPDSFWVNHRPDTLTKFEAKVYANVDSLQHMKSFKRLMDWSTFLLAGYKQAGPVEIGPASTFYSFNPVEGFRLRLGGRTTTHFSNRFYTEAYGAYGFKDQKWKYFVSGTYSINNKSIYSFPQEFVRVSYQKETDIPGQQLQFVQEDNFLLSFKRGNNDKWTYNNNFRINYVHEYKSHLSWYLGYRWWEQTPAGTISYVKFNNGGIDTIRQSDITSGRSRERSAGACRTSSSAVYREVVPGALSSSYKYPILDLRWTTGVSGLFRGQYTYQNIDFNIYKRFYESFLGYTDITGDFGYIIGKVPFPLADVAHANQTYAYQLQSYNLMNFPGIRERPLCYGVAIDHYFNGFFFNKIPFLKKAPKWREVIEAKILYGGLAKLENDPTKNPNAVKFPFTNGQGGDLFAE